MKLEWHEVLSRASVAGCMLFAVFFVYQLQFDRATFWVALAIFWQNAWRDS